MEQTELMDFLHVCISIQYSPRIDAKSLNTSTNTVIGYTLFQRLMGVEDRVRGTRSSRGCYMCRRSTVDLFVLLRAGS
jgi:hypothetical protein